MPGRRSVAAILAGAAHVWTWGAGMLLVFGTAYQGVRVTYTESGDPVRVETSKSLIEVNGVFVLALLAVPVLVTLVAVIGVRRIAAGEPGRKTTLWATALVLLGFCVLGMLSVGFLYLPAALALLGAACAESRWGALPARRHE